MTYNVSLVIGGVTTAVTAPAQSASVETHTEGLDSLEVSVTWALNALRDDPNYDVIAYAWPGSLTRIQLRREDDDSLVFDGQVHAIEASRDEDSFTIRAQS